LVSFFSIVMHLVFQRLKQDDQSLI